MESVGLTGKQLRKMLLLEIVMFSSGITVLTGILGSGMFYIIGNMMKARMGYFAFRFPIAEFAACAVLLFTSCVLIVYILYRKYDKGSVAQRLRVYED